MNVPAGFDALFRQLTPLVLLGVMVVVVAEPWLPGAGWIRANLGEQALLRGAVLVLAAYTLLLWGEALRLHTMLSGVLSAFRRFDGTRRADAAPQPEVRLEAARLLLPALRSDDPKLRASSRDNLARLAGEDFGDDYAKWEQWLQRQQQALDAAKAKSKSTS